MSKVRLLKFSSFYPEYLEKLYRENPDLKTSSYAAQYKAMMDQGIGWADYWKINLEKTDQFEVELVIVNNEYAQKTWAREHHINYSNDNWLSDIVTKQAQHFQPDIFFPNDYVFVNPSLIHLVRQNTPSIRKTIGWDGVGLLDAERFRGCDIMLSCNTNIAGFYEANGYRGLFFPFAFETSILNKLDTSNKKYDISFAGSLTLRPGGHHERLKLLGAVAKKFDVDYWLASFDESKLYLIKNILKKMRSGQWSDVKDILRLWHINKGSVFGIEMYQTLAWSHITLNSHIDTSFSVGGNIRLWEATGVGTCLVTDWKENLSEIFEPDKEVVVYKSPQECVEKIKYLLDHPKEMEAIAKAGQQRTLTQYSYEKRMRDFAPVLLSLL